MMAERDPDPHERSGLPPRYVGGSCEERISPHLDPWLKLEEVGRKLTQERAYSGQLYSELNSVYVRVGVELDLRKAAYERIEQLEEALEELTAELIFYKGF